VRRFLAIACGLLTGALLAPGLAHAQSFTLTQQSDPPGIVVQGPTALPAGSSVTSVFAPPSATATGAACAGAAPASGVQRFKWWERDGQRVAEPAPTLRSANPITFTLVADTTIVARYVDEACDADGDGVKDFQEFDYFGVLTTANATFDAIDNDGIGFADELRFGGHPRLRDRFVAGSLSAARGASSTIILDPQLSWYTESSDPQGIVLRRELVRAGDAVTTQVAPVTSGTLAFAEWRINGVRAADALGRALNPVNFTFTANATAVARYVDAAVDDDGDGIPDAYEIEYFGDLAQDAASDLDSDGVGLVDERRLGSSPRVRDRFVAGSLSQTRSPTLRLQLAELVAYTIQSDPPNVFPTQSDQATAGTVITTPSYIPGAGTPCFSHWTVNGTRAADALGQPLQQVSQALAAPTSFTAIFVDCALDTDGDGLPDWLERGQFGSANSPNGPSSDPDGDGIAIVDELRLGLSLRVADRFVAGSLSQVRSATRALDLRPFPRVRETLVDGIPALFFAADPQAAPPVGAFQGVGASSVPLVGDWDGDGDGDLIVLGDGGVAAFENRGSPVVASYTARPALGAAIAAQLPAGSRFAGLGDFNSDGRADLVIGGEGSSVRLLPSGGTFGGASLGAAIDLDLGAARVVPALGDLTGDCRGDLVVVRADGRVRVHPNSGSASAPFAAGTFVDAVAVADGTPQASAASLLDTDGDNVADLLVADAGGRLSEYRRSGAGACLPTAPGGALAGAFALVSRAYGATAPGFAPRFAAVGADPDGDGDADVIAGYAAGGLLYLRNQTERLVVDPPARTLLVGTGQILRPRAPPSGVVPPPPGYARGTVSWRFVANRSGGTLDAASGQYVAGPTRGVVDVIEALDDRGAEGIVAGRSYVNVIGPADQTQAGKAVIIAGGLGVNDSVWPATNALANKAYRTLLFRGFRKDNIRYLSLDPNQDVDGNGLYDDIWRPTNFQFAQDALRNFGRGSNELFIALIDHGATVSNDGAFVLRRPAGGTPERLLASEVNTWLGELQSGPAPTDARLLMDFCFAGSFLQRLAAGPTALGQRVLMGSTGPNQLAYLLSGGRISYSDTWLSAALQGFDLRTTSNLAGQSMAAYQAGQLDDDRNAVANEAGDGAVAAGVRLGPSFVVGQDIPVVEQVSPPQALPADSATAEVLLSGVTSVYPIERSWCAVVPPGAAVAGEAPVTQASEFDLAFDAPTRGWKGSVGGFTANGTYNLGCYVRDVWGSVSFPSVTQVVQSGYVQRLLLVVGGAEGQPRFEEANAAGNAVYRAALLRGIPKAAIRYLNPRTSQDVDGDGDAANDVAAAPGTASFSAAFAQASTGADEVSVFLVSGASSGTFELAPGQQLSAATLDGLLDGWQDAPNRVANVVLEFGDAAGWIAALAPVGCPTACPTDPAQHRDRFVLSTTPAGIGNLMGNGGVLSATQVLVSNVLAGRSLGDAIVETQPVLNFMTPSNARQTLRYDLARPDLVGTSGYAPGNANDARDLAEVRGRYFGPGFALGVGVPQIARRTPATVLPAGAPLFLWADGVTSSQDIVRVWAVVQPPGASGALPEVDLALNPATQRWEGTYTATTTPGEYRALVYARDRQGNITPARRAPDGGGSAIRGTVSVPSTAPLTVGGSGPRVQFAQATGTVAEGASASVTIVLDAPRATPLRVPLAILGTATNQADYRVLLGAVDSPVEIVFAAGATTATLSVPALPDAIDDPGEVVVLTLGAPSDPAVALGANNTLTLAITDPGAPADLLFRNGFEPAARAGE
jgi:hypothetical protein